MFINIFIYLPDDKYEPEATDRDGMIWIFLII